MKRAHDQSSLGGDFFYYLTLAHPDIVREVRSPLQRPRNRVKYEESFPETHVVGNDSTPWVSGGVGLCTGDDVSVSGKWVHVSKT